MHHNEGQWEEECAVCVRGGGQKTNRERDRERDQEFNPLSASSLEINVCRLFADIL
jgi:hypothetical protein